jgi:hypothetical protein
MNRLGYVRLAWLLVLTLPLSSMAQITVHQSDFPSPGTIGAQHYISEASFSVGSSGASQEWSFAQTDWEATTIIHRVDPATTPYAAQFPNANLALQFEAFFVYMRAADDGMFKQGQASADEIIQYVGESREFAFPLTYQLEWTAVARWQSTPEPGITITSVDSAVSVIDGWGTITTPYFSGPVLRKFEHHWVTYQLNDFPAEPVDEFIGFQWINQHSLPVAAAWAPDSLLDPEFTAGELEMLELPDAVGAPHAALVPQFAVGQNYPNPFNLTSVIPLELVAPAVVTLRVTDITGRLVMQRGYTLSAGAHALPLAADGWSSGAYFATITAGPQQSVLRLTLLK